MFENVKFHELNILSDSVSYAVNNIAIPVWFTVEMLVEFFWICQWFLFFWLMLCQDREFSSKSGPFYKYFQQSFYSQLISQKDYYGTRMIGIVWWKHHLRRKKHILWPIYLPLSFFYSKKEKFSLKFVYSWIL